MGKTKRKGHAKPQWKTEAIPMPLPKDRKPRKKKGKAGARALIDVEVIPMPPPERGGQGGKIKVRRDIEAFPPPMPPARATPGTTVAVTPLPVPGRRTKKRAAMATPLIRTEVIPMPIPDRSPPDPRKKGSAQVQWKTEAIPMPIPKGRKPKPSGKK